MPIPPRYLQLLIKICNLPTAPFCEEHVIRWLTSWADRLALRHWRDDVGNLSIEYLHGPPTESPLALNAHLDHPGFFAINSRKEPDGPDYLLHAEFRGGVDPAIFPGKLARFFLPDSNPTTDDGTPRGLWIDAKILAVQPREHSRALDVWLKCRTEIPYGTLGMWNLPDAKVHDDRFTAPACDDLAGCAAIACVFEELAHTRPHAHVIAFFDRAEEVGLAGAIAACRNQSLPKNARIIGIDTSGGPFGVGPNKMGPIVRTGDRTGLFSPGLTHFLEQSACVIADEDPDFKFIRSLLDRGICNTTAFIAWGYDAAALAIPLGHYHNMSAPRSNLELLGRAKPTPPEIVPEFIHHQHFHGTIRILLEAIHRYPTYKPNCAEIRQRLESPHLEEHLPRLKEIAPRADAQ